MNLKFTQSAQRDLIRLRDFIAEKNPEAAKRVSSRLRRAIGQLVDQPGMGVSITDLPGVRDLVSGDYVVRYTALDDTVYILRVWHGREAR